MRRSATGTFPLFSQCRSQSVGQLTDVGPDVGQRTRVRRTWRRLARRLRWCGGMTSEFRARWSPDELLHQRLSEFNRTRLSPALPSFHWKPDRKQDELLELEEDFVMRERLRVRARALSAPRDADAFVDWFEQLKETGPGQGDPLFPWLASEAPEWAMFWFLEQEVAGEAGFEDLVALTQVKLPTQAKLELARNYWDEMGQGHVNGMHGRMLSQLAKELHLGSGRETVVWEAIALGNLMLALAMNRRYTYHSLGALGAIELTAPGRAALVNEGLRRLGVAGQVRKYFALHATLDVKHSEAWNSEVIRPLVAADPEVAVAIAEGALMRLNAGARCFVRYRHELGLDAPIELSA
jgi:hypothetical protein